MRDRAFVPIVVVVTAVMLALSAPAEAQPAGFSRVTVVSGLDQPTAFAFKGVKLLVAEKASGKVQFVLANGSLRPTPYVTLSVSAQSERGVLGIAVDPDFAVNGFVYVYYTTGPGALDYTGSPKNRVSRFTTVGGVGTNETIILDNLPSDAGNHNGGDIQFGFDGMLYVAVGDGGAFHADALTLDTLRGKILRVNPVNGKAPVDNPYKVAPGTRRCARPAGVPPGNGPCQEIYAYGLRNPFRLSLRESNSSILIGDVGEGTWEELNTLVPNGNYGWNVVEGPCFLGPNVNCNPSQTSYPAEYQYPVHFYNHGSGTETGNTIIAGAFAENGSAYPAPYAGAYFYGDYAAGWIHVLIMNAANHPTGPPLPFALLSSPVAFRNGQDGSIYVLSIGAGALYKYVYTAP